MSKKTQNALKNETIKFKMEDSIYRLMHQWLMTLQEVYTEYHKQVTSGTEDTEERRRAIGNMLMMIDFVDAPEQVLTPNLKDQEARDALKGMLGSARVLKNHMRGDIEREQTKVGPELQELVEEVDEQLKKVK